MRLYTKVRAITLLFVFVSHGFANKDGFYGLYFGGGMHLGMGNTCTVSSMGGPFYDDANYNGKQDPGESSIALPGSQDFAYYNFGNGEAANIGAFWDPSGSNFFNMTSWGFKTELLFRYIPSATEPVFMADWRTYLTLCYVLEGYFSLGGHFLKHQEPTEEMLFVETRYGPKNPTYKSGPKPFTMGLGGGIVLPLFKHLQIAGQIGGFMTGGDAYWHGGEIVITIRYFLEMAE